jgi:hypothetical protein
MTLEELILRHALGRPLQSMDRDRRAAGVMMIPIPRAGRLRGVRGLEAASAVRHVEDVVISAHPGQELIPLPEGWQYLGFISPGPRGGGRRVGPAHRARGPRLRPRRRAADEVERPRHPPGTSRTTAGSPHDG